MTHLEIIKKAYDECGIIYIVKSKVSDYGDEYQYLLLAGNKKRIKELEAVSVDMAIYTVGHFMEFQKGMIASY